MKMILCIFMVALVLEEESLWTFSEFFLFSSTILTCHEGYIYDTYSEYVLDSAWLICHRKTLTQSCLQLSHLPGHQKPLNLWVSRCSMSQQIQRNHLSFLSSFLFFISSFIFSLWSGISREKGVFGINENIPTLNYRYYGEFLWFLRENIVTFIDSCNIPKKLSIETQSSIQFSSVQLLRRVRLFATPWIAAHQAFLSITNSRSSLRLTSIKSVMPSSHLILCCPLLLLPPIPPIIRVFSNESALHMRWPKYWSFSFSIISSKEIPGLISFRMDWLDLLAVQGTLKSLLQHHSSKASILQHLVFFTSPTLTSIHDHRKNHSLD